MFHSRALMRCAWGLPVVAVVVLRAAVEAQTPAAPTPAPLTIAGDVSKPLTLSPADLKTYPRATATIQDEERAVTYEGVLLGEVLSRAGAPLGAELRGNNVASYVLAKARDGYQRPLRIVAPGDKRARSIRMLERIEIVRVSK
jgi:DMSO/TMAO reductase YedYZ molybdopterin-dependent catalytic subunit